MKRIVLYAWLVIVLIFMYLPIFLLAVYSFTDAKNMGIIGAFSLDNYKMLFVTPELRNMIIGTFILAFGSALIATIIGTCGAIGAFYSKKHMRGIFNTVNQIPVVNADVVTGFSICMLTACNDKLDPEVDLNQSEEQILRDYNNTGALLNNIYAYMPNGLYYIDNAMMASACDEAEHTLETSTIQKYNTGKSCKKS